MIGRHIRGTAFLRKRLCYARVRRIAYSRFFISRKALQIAWNMPKYSQIGGLLPVEAEDIGIRTIVLKSCRVRFGKSGVFPTTLLRYDTQITFHRGLIELKTL